MKIIGIIMLTILTGGIYGIVYAITRKSRLRKMNDLERATITYAFAYEEFEEDLSDEDKQKVVRMNAAMGKLRKAEQQIMGD